MSSLLNKLAVETRQQIFGYVLGGESIHATLKPAVPSNGSSSRESARQYRLDICPQAESLSDSDSRVHHILPKDVDVFGMPFTTRHFTCCANPSGSKVRKSLNLDLLLTCRQIYSEAALLPFAVNDFTVEFGLGREATFAPGVNVLECLLGTLSPQQRNAIKHLTVASRDSNSADGVQIERLRGLKSLQVIHTHFFGHLDAEAVPGQQAALFSWGDWTRGLQMPVLDSVRHLAELQPARECPEGCWSVEQVDDIDRTLRGWECKLLECVREGRDGRGFDDDDDDDDARIVDEEEGEDGKDQGDVEDDDRSVLTEEEQQRLAEIRVRLPRDGTESSDLVFWVTKEEDVF